jgi:acyl-coenzyme A synthetase/AMP-(fatty) acid ligase
MGLSQPVTANALAAIVLGAAGVNDRALVSDPARTVTRTDLLTEAAETAECIASAADGGSAVVAVRLPLGVDAVTLLAAAILGDHTICFVDPTWGDDRASEVVRAVRANVLVDADGLHRLYPAAGQLVTEGRAAGYVAMSSGSLGGGPKGVLALWNGIAAFVESGAAALELDIDSTWGELSHPSYDMAMTNLLLALSRGSSITLSDRLADRFRPLRHASRTGVTHLRVAPRLVDLAAADRDRYASTVRVWGSGGDRLLTAQLEVLFDLGVPVVVNTYGTSESIGFASSARLHPGAPGPSWQGCATIGVGEVGDWRTSLQPTCDSGAALLSVTTPHLPTGYLFGRSTSEYPRWESDDCIATGDVGAVTDGQLFCLGRIGRRVKRGGLFVDLDRIDAAATTRGGSRTFTVVTDAGILLSLLEGGEDPDVVRSSLTTILPPTLVPDRLVPVRQLPRLGNGKIDQAAALALAAEQPA